MRQTDKLADPGYESKRISALRSYHILDTLTEEEYENVTYLASVICDVPIAVISFVDEKRQWFKSHRGLPAAETLREYSFCAHALNKPQEFLIVPDSRKDERFKDNPLVTGETNVVFYAGVPLVNEQGFGLGTVCVIDRKPRELTPEQLKALRILSNQVMSMLETRKSNLALERAAGQLQNRTKELENSVKILEKSEERLRTMSEGTDVLISVVDGDNDPVFFTKAWSSVTGKSVEELLLFGWNELLHPDDRERYRDIYLEAFENRMPYSVEFRLRHESGEYTWLLSQGSPQLLEDGRFNGFITSTVDISERKHSEMVLADTTRRLEMALEAGRLGTYELDLRSGNMKTSPRYNDNFGLPPQARCSLSSMLSMIVPEDRPAVDRAFVSAVKENRLYDAEYRIRLPNGEQRWIHTLGLPVYDEEGEAINLSGVSINTTGQKTFTEELERQVKERTGELNKRNLDLENINRELQSFAYIVSHDLQEPLRRIETFVHSTLELDRDKLSEQGKEYLKRIQGSAGKMRQLIEDLLNYSRTTSTERVFEKACLKEIVEEIKDDFKDQIEQKQGTVAIADMCEISVIPFQFRNLMQNLFSNAIKFSANDRPLHIAVECDMGKGRSYAEKDIDPETTYCHISVADNGIGFDPVFSGKIFNLFQRLNNKNDYIGNGIGLSIAKRIVENHNGTITATAAPGQGARFDIYLPVL